MTVPQIIVEIAFTVGASTSTYLHLDDPTRGKLDTGTLGPDVTWVDVSSYLRRFTIDRQCSRTDTPILRYEPGHATIALNNADRRFDPDNDDGPYVSAGATQVTPMRAVRIRAVWDDVTYDLFRGYADNWDILWYDPNDSEAIITCTDAMKVLTNDDRAAVAGVGAGEQSGARINRILDSVAWSATDRLISTGNITCQATTLEGNALTELQLTADSDLGELYVDGAGRVVFRGRFDVVTDTRSNVPQALFGDGGGSELTYDNADGLKTSYSDQQLINEARIGRVGGAVQTASDAASQSRYLKRSFERSDLIMESDADAAAYAAWIVLISKDPELRFDAMIITPQRDPDTLFEQVLGREIGDRITIRRRPPGGGDLIERDVWIRGISHEGGPEHWKTVWTLQAATKTVYFLELDDTTTGRLDSYALG